ncbi:hypothetical protein BDQ12DRAFT_613887, partial [Crucibulum laeve]
MIPLFRLDHLPPQKIFLKPISVDHYGNRGCADSTPEEYRYNWAASPPIVNPKLNELYHSLYIPARAGLPVHVVCGLPEDPSRRETVRIRLYEVLVGLCLRKSNTASSLHRLENASMRFEIPEMLVTLAVGLVALVLHPIIIRSSRPVRLERLQTLVTSIKEYTWIHPDVCIFVTTHLNDASNRQAAITGIITEMRRRPYVTKVTYGICFSFFHCIIVRIN